MRAFELNVLHFPLLPPEKLATSSSHEKGMSLIILSKPGDIDQWRRAMVDGH